MSWRNTLGTATKAFLCSVGVLVAVWAAWFGLIALVSSFVGPDGGEAWGHGFLMWTFFLAFWTIVAIPALLILFYRRFRR
jgi:hypothetical protein